MHQAVYNPKYLSVGFGGSQGGKYAVQCKDGHTAIGKICFILPMGSNQVFVRAALDCSDQGGTMYAPIDQTQNAIMAGLLEKWVR